MSHHWQAMGNHLSHPLQQTWNGIAHVFNRRIAQQFNDCWDVLALPTGSGKTQSLALYCSMLERERHPGVLIVTSLKEQADEICMQINGLASAEIAVAHHTDRRQSVSQLHHAPVLAVTHARYLRALQAVAEQSECQHKHRSLTSWAGGERLLRVVDEAIEMHQTHKISLEELSIFQGALRYLIQPRNRLSLRCIEQICASIFTWSEIESSSERYLSNVEFRALQSIDLDALEEELDCISENYMDFGLDGGVPGKDIKRRCLRTVRTIRDLVRVGDPWITKRGKQVTLAAAENLLGLEERPGVILDATARVDARYELLEGKAQITAPIPGVRNYSNVNLWVVPDQRVGKEYMIREDGWKLWTPLAEQVKQKLGSERSVLVCCHKDVQEQIESSRVSFTQTAYAHWGAITGRNEWRDYDTVVIFGLNYLDRSATAETFLGMRGATSNDWLQSRVYRRFNRHDDIRDALRMSHLAISVIQAVNRVRCRRTSDTFGGCDRTDIILLLPREAEGRPLVDMLQAEMPGLRVREWPMQARTRKERAAPSKDRVLGYLRDAPEGLHTNKEVIAKLDVSRATYDRIIAGFRNENSAEAHQLRLYGVRYIHYPGRGNPSGFMKGASVAA